MVGGLVPLVLAREEDPVLVTRLFEQRNADAFSWLERERCYAYQDTDDPIAVIAERVKTLAASKLRLGIEKTYLSFLPIGAYSARARAGALLQLRGLTPSRDAITDYLEDAA